MVSDLRKLNVDCLYIYTDIDLDTPKTNSKYKLRKEFLKFKSTLYEKKD